MLSFMIDLLSILCVLAWLAGSLRDGSSDTETDVVAFSQWRVLFGCQVSLPSAEKPSPMSSHLRNNLDVDLERFVGIATLESES